MVRLGQSKIKIKQIITCNNWARQYWPEPAACAAQGCCKQNKVAIIISIFFPCGYPFKSIPIISTIDNIFLTEIHGLHIQKETKQQHAYVIINMLTRHFKILLGYSILFRTTNTKQEVL